MLEGQISKDPKIVVKKNPFQMDLTLLVCRHIREISWERRPDSQKMPMLQNSLIHRKFLDPKVAQLVAQFQNFVNPRWCRRPLVIPKASPGTQALQPLCWPSWMASMLGGVDMRWSRSRKSHGENHGKTQLISFDHVWIVLICEIHDHETWDASPFFLSTTGDDQLVLR